MTRPSSSALIRFAPRTGEGEGADPPPQVALAIATRLEGVLTWARSREGLFAQLVVQFAEQALSLCDRLVFLGPTVKGHPAFCLDDMEMRYHWSECAYAGLSGDDWLIYSNPAPTDDDPLLAIGWPAGNLWRAFDWSLVGPNYVFDPPLTDEDTPPQISLSVPSLTVRLPMRLYASEVGETQTHLIAERIYTEAPALTGGRGVLRADTHGDPVWSIRSSDLRAAIGAPVDGAVYELYWRIYKGEGDILYQLLCNYIGRPDIYRDRRGTPAPDGSFPSGGFGVFETCDALAARVRFQPVPGPFILKDDGGAISVGGDQGILASPSTEAGFDGSWSSTVAGRYFALSWSGHRFYLGGRIAWVASSVFRLSGVYAAAIRETTYLSRIGEDENGMPLYEPQPGVECVSIRLRLRNDGGGHDVQVWRRVLRRDAEDQLIGIITDPPNNTPFAWKTLNHWTFSPQADQVLAVFRGRVYNTGQQQTQRLETTIHHADIPPSPAAKITGPITNPWVVAASRIAHQIYLLDRNPQFQVFEIYSETREMFTTEYLVEEIEYSEDGERWPSIIVMRPDGECWEYFNASYDELTIQVHLHITSTFNYLAGAYFEPDGSVTLNQFEIKADWEFDRDYANYTFGSSAGRRVYDCTGAVEIYAGEVRHDDVLLYEISIKHSGLTEVTQADKDELAIHKKYYSSSLRPSEDGGYLVTDVEESCTGVPLGHFLADVLTRPPRFVLVSEDEPLDGCGSLFPLYNSQVGPDAAWREANLRAIEKRMIRVMDDHNFFVPGQLNRLLSANGDEFLQYVVDDERITEINGTLYADQPRFQAALGSPHACLFAPEPYPGENWIPPDPGGDDDIGALLAAHNAIRVDAGLEPLGLAGALSSAALAHLLWMEETGTMSHTGAGGSSPQDRAQAAGYLGSAGENLAAGQTSIAQVMAEWMASPGHRANILHPPYRDWGAAIAPSPRWGGLLWVVVFGVPPA